MKLERISPVPERRISAQEGSSLALGRRTAPPVFTKRSAEFSSSASPVVKSEEHTQPSFAEAYTEVNKRLEAILAETLQLIATQISEEGRRVLQLAMCRYLDSFLPFLRAVSLRTLESLKKLHLTGAAKDASDIETVLGQAAKRFESRFNAEIIPFLTTDNVGDLEAFQSKLIYSYVKKGDTGSQGRIWNVMYRFVIRDTTEKPVTERSVAAPGRVEIARQDAAPKKEDRATSRDLIRRLETAFSEKEPGEPWLDQEREQAFKTLSGAFKDMVEGPEGLAAFQRWFVDFFNVTIEAAGRPALTVNDIQSVVVVEATSGSANMVAGKELKRPVIVFNDLRELQNFAYVLTGSESGRHARGFVISPKSFGDEPVLGKTGMIFSFGVGEGASHEIRHTIDPYVHKREDHLIDEAFAYFSECFSKDEDLRNDMNWKRLISNVRASESTNHAASARGGETASDERMNRFIKALKAYAQGKTLVQVQRFLVQCRSVEELVKKAEQTA